MLLFLLLTANINIYTEYLYIITDKAVPDGKVSNIPSLIHLVILQSLGDTTFFKRAVQTERIHLVILQLLGDTAFFKRAIQTDTQSL